MKDKKVPIPLNEKATLNLGQLLKVEEEILKERRNIRNENKNLREDSLGIALSGGGIRSATICLGIMEKLNSIGLLKKSDYLSSVSGGGYLASYIHMARNKSNPTTYEKLFDKEVISHFRNYRTHFFIAPRFKLFSNAFLGLILLSSFLMSWMWIILPTYFFIFSGMGTFLHYVILLFLFILPGIFLSPNFTSLHRFYKNRLSKAYLWLNQNIKLIQLTDINSPYPLINATVHVNKDDYHNADSVSYRGNINSNYFLFSPFYCGSQVTRYAKNSASSYSNFTLGSAMATSGAAINTFMGNMNIFVPIRWLMILLNVRIGLLAPSPFLKRKIPVFWPYYTLLEFLGKARTTSYKIQVSDGGHIENLGVYELIRRKVKTIIAIDCGQDNNFNFKDLRNLVIRAKNELGAIIEFDENSNPLTLIKPNIITGASKKNFAIAKISGIKGSYAEGYNGVLIYVKSSILEKKEFKIRKLKHEVEALKGEKKEDFELKRRELDYTMYRTYTPDFPHQTTSDQFFTGEQWDAYYELGKNVGNNLIHDLDFKGEDSRLEILKKIQNYIGEKDFGEVKFSFSKANEKVD